MDGFNIIVSGFAVMSRIFFFSPFVFGSYEITHRFRRIVHAVVPNWTSFRLRAWQNTIYAGRHSKRCPSLHRAQALIAIVSRILSVADDLQMRRPSDPTGSIFVSLSASLGVPFLAGGCIGMYVFGVTLLVVAVISVAIARVVAGNTLED